MSELALQLIVENKETKAKTLDLGNCDLTELPPEVMECVWLEELILGSVWNEYNFDIGQWEMKVSQNKGQANSISILPDSIGQLEMLSKFIISSTQVTDLAPIAGLTNLQILSFDSTQVADLNPIARLTNLRILFFDYIKATDLNPIAGLTNLQILSFDSTHVADLTPIASLINLQILYFDSSRVADLTPIAGHTKLQSLNCSSKQVADLTPIARLTNLQQLFCYSTQVVDLTPIAGLTNLQQLDCSYTQVADLNPIAQLTDLQQLDCSYTQVADLNPIAQLTNLQQLNCRQTQIIDLGHLNWAHFKNLEQLDISETKISDLFTLQPLIIQGLRVKWNYLEDGICVQNCPITNPPIEIVKQGNKAILQYFEEVEIAHSSNSLIRLAEAKCLILGEGGAGKTSLTHKLIDRDQALPTEKDTTKGIMVHPLDRTLPDGTVFRLNIWDFGGQEIYHATHQFFLTKRSLYILLDDTRKDEKTVNDPVFNYWLQVAELYGGGSPLLIVQNEKGDRSKELDLRGMQGRFGFVKDAKAVNLLSCRGLDKVWEAIEFWIKQLPHIGEEQPKAWLDIRRELERLAQEDRRDHISLEEYYRLCAAHDIPEHERALFLSGYLHDFGAFLHFQEHPLLRKTLVLNNQWATDAVYRVLDCEAVKGSFGRFTRRDLAAIWAEPCYLDQHEELLALMEKFELCYKLPGEKTETWLAPQLLSVLQPDALFWPEGGNLQVRYEYEFMPKGLLSQHIVRMHRYVRRPELAWKSGVVFERAGSQALVTEAWGARKVSLWACGPQAKELLTLLTEDFDQLHERLAGLKVKKMIPCNCRKCSTAPEPHFYDYEDLAGRKAKGKPTVECRASWENVLVTGLLDGVFTEVIELAVEHTNQHTQIKNIQPNTFMDNQVDQLNPKPLRLYISYSNKDQAYRDKLLSHLNPLVKKGQIEIWSDHLLQAGDKFMEIFQEELARMDIWVVLISTEALNSNFIWDNEYPVAQERQVPIVPILLRPAAWQGSPIEHLYILPSFAKPITKWEDEDEAFLDVVNGIGKLVAAKRKAMPAKTVVPPAPVVTPPPPAAAFQTRSTGTGKKSKPALQTVKIFLASSSELLEDRDQFEIFINRENKELVKKGIFLELVRWEDFLDAMAKTRLQDEYNKTLRECEFVVCLFFTKVGKYTAEEFDTALGEFRQSGKPKIYIYFKDAPVKPSALPEFQTVLRFKKKLAKLGHFPNHYEKESDLALHFKGQLQKLGYGV